MLALRFSTAALVILLLASWAAASSGDRAGIYQRCVANCESVVCTDWSWTNSLPLALRLTRWSCVDDCRYGCMHSITNDAIAHSIPVQQYHGKWPFWRYAGMQEPASVAFSLLNLLSHARGARRIQRMIPDSHPMKRYYVGFALTSMNAWVWSSVFHTRDLPATEKLDYFAAALAILYALYIAVVRLFHLYPHDTRVSLVTKERPSTPKIYIGWTCICLHTYLGHVSYLSLLPRFDYTYNMIFNLAIGMTHNVFWITYSLPSSVPVLHRFPFRPLSYRPSYASRAGLFVLYTMIATSLELFDFPPWRRIIDAHSLWHFATAPIAIFWYEFLILDSLDEGWRASRSS